MNHVKYVRSNEVNDVFSYIDCEGTKVYVDFPRSMEMTVDSVDEWLSE